VKLKPARVGDLVRKCWAMKGLDEPQEVGVVVEKQGINLKVWWSGAILYHPRVHLEVISKA
jgi:hypothetical protein